MEKKLYTLLVYSENIAGILNQITAVFTRRQVNIESLNVSASSIEGIHKYTITAWSDPDQIEKITKQIEKKIDVVKAKYYTDDQLFIREAGLYKLSTQVVLENPEISRIIRRQPHLRGRDEERHDQAHRFVVRRTECLWLRPAIYPQRAHRHHAKHRGGGERVS